MKAGRTIRMEARKINENQIQEFLFKIHSCRMLKLADKPSCLGGGGSGRNDWYGIKFTSM